MRSRYSAYALGLYDYIIKTTHPDNNDFNPNSQNWKNEIEDFCQTTQFMNLSIHEFMDGDNEAFVTFCATLSSGELNEKSRFLKIGEQWLYESGEFNQKELQLCTTPQGKNHV